MLSASWTSCSSPPRRTDSTNASASIRSAAAGFTTVSGASQMSTSADGSTAATIRCSLRTLAPETSVTRTSVPAAKPSTLCTAVAVAAAEAIGRLGVAAVNLVSARMLRSLPHAPGLLAASASTGVPSASASTVCAGQQPVKTVNGSVVSIAGSSGRSQVTVPAMGSTAVTRYSHVPGPWITAAPAPGTNPSSASSAEVVRSAGCAPVAWAVRGVAATRTT